MNLICFENPNFFTTKQSHVLTLQAPSNHSVYSRPTEKINRKIVDMKKVRMAYGLTPNMVTSARDPNMAVQISPESLGSSSETNRSHHQRHTYQQQHSRLQQINLNLPGTYRLVTHTCIHELCDYKSDTLILIMGRKLPQHNWEKEKHIEHTVKILFLQYNHISALLQYFIYSY